MIGPHVIGFPTPDFATPEASLADAGEFMERYRDHPTVVPAVASTPSTPRPSTPSRPPSGSPSSTTLTAGIPVGLGTDGPASNNDLDMFDEMDAAAKVQKFMLGDPAALPAETAFRMATMGGARVLNLHDEIGSLEPGKRADIVLVDMQRPGLTPLYRVYSHLVYAARGSDVTTVIVNGRVVVVDREIRTVDEEEVMERAPRHSG